MNVDGDFFLNGITNGALWYHVAGGMQDWQYVNTNCLEITVEMGCYKFPQKSMLPHLWDEHKYSLFAYMEYVHRGIFYFFLLVLGYTFFVFLLFVICWFMFCFSLLLDIPFRQRTWLERDGSIDSLN